MRCIFCKGKMVDDTTTDFTDLKTSMIIIKNVPCQKCTQCGEVVYDLVVGERLEAIIDNLKDSFTEVAIVKYSDAAA